MKKLIYLLLTIISLGAVSCSDLETTTLSNTSEDVVFNSVTFTGYSVTGLYALLTQDQTYSARLALNYTTNSDIEFVGANATSYKENTNRGLSNYLGTADNTSIAKEWTLMYKLIERANVCITGIRNSSLLTSGSAEEQNQMKAYLGEALTIRSLMYFELARNWGDVPFKQERTNPDLSNAQLPVTDRDTIYDNIITDLQEAETYVPWVGNGIYTSTEKVTKGFVKGLIAKICLTRGGYSIRNKEGYPTERGSNWEKYYQIANKECKEIIESNNHSLTPSYQQIFKNLCALTVNSNENLFEVANGLQNSGEMGYSIGIRFYTNSKYGFGNNANVVNTSAYYYYAFDKKDTRRDATIGYYTYSNSSGDKKEFFQTDAMSYNFQKWDQRYITNPSWISANKAANGKFGYGINWVIMRYSDVLLMYAETENELLNGPTAEAIKALKQVRTRAFAAADVTEKVDAYVNNLTDHDSFFNAIVNERAWEFGGEGIRKYDLIRWNLLVSKIQEQRDAFTKMINGESVTIMGNTYATLPGTLFYKYQTDGEVIDKTGVNFYDNWGSDPIDGYTSVAWLSGLSDASKTSLKDKVRLFSSGLTENSASVYNRHLFPIPASVISSNTKIKNGYGF
jgi:SusD family.